MWNGGTVEVDHEWAATRAADYEREWKAVHAKLREIARSRIALEAEEATYLREAEDLHVFRKLGHATMVDYLVRELHYSRHAANERMRVARELVQLPKLAAAFRAGELPFASIRELTRVATPQTEGAFLAKAEGKDSTQVARMVSGLKKGDAPEARPDPALIRRPYVLELDPETIAELDQRRKALEKSLGRRATDIEVARALLTASDAPGEAAPRTNHGLTTCKHCHQAFLVAGSEQLPVDARTAERLRCDCVELGDLESEEPTRAKPAIPAATRRKVMARHGGCCAVPGCHARRYVDLHHILHREDGGSHHPSNLIPLCFAHHKAHHDGLVAITGRAPHGVRFEWVRDDDVDSPLAVPAGTG